MRPLPPTASMQERRDGGAPPGTTVLIPNASLTPLPKEIDPTPAAIVSGKWRMTLTPAVDSEDLSLPGDPYYGLTCLVAFGTENRIYLTSSGGALRLDLMDNVGSPRTGGLLSWTGTPTIHVTIDVPANTITVESSGVTFGGGWDNVTGDVATKVLAPWVWEGTVTNWGGFFGLFPFVGSITDVVEVP